MIIFLVTACLPIHAETKWLNAPSADIRSWKVTDLKYFNPQLSVDLPPDEQLIAVYARANQTGLDLRLEYLDLPQNPNVDICIYIYSHPSVLAPDKSQEPESGKWDYKIQISTDLNVSITSKDNRTSELQSRVSGIKIDPLLDSLILHLDSALLPSTPKNLILQVRTNPISVDHPANYTGPISMVGSRVNRASLLLAFWNSFLAHSPSQALRRWDGAHTGPFGQRHGLRYLLEEARKNSIPIILLDLKNPSSLSALDQMGKISLIQDMVKEQILLLPDVASVEPDIASRALQNSRLAGKLYDLPASQGAFSASAVNYPFVFAELDDSNHMFQSSGQHIIPLPSSIYPPSGIPSSSVEDISPDGLGVETKRSLLQIAASGDPSQLLVLGGSLPESPWGDSSIAPAVFNQLVNSPWINVINWNDLLSFPPTNQQPVFKSGCHDLVCTPPILPIIPYTDQGDQFPAEVSYPNLQSEIRNRLELAPPSRLREQAWDMFVNLTMPTDDPMRQQLQANYLPDMGFWLGALEWLRKPKTISNCSRDLNFDGSPDCILATEQLFTAYKVAGGRLMLAVTQSPDRSIVWVSSTGTAGVGFSDPLDWNLEQGTLSDPEQVSGAFVDTTQPVEKFQVQATPGQLTFTPEDPNRTGKRIYSIVGSDLHFADDLAHQERLELPIPIQVRLSSEIAANAMDTNTKLEEVILTVNSGEVNMDSANDSKDLLQSPENPNLTYPHGHYLPYPFTVVHILPDINRGIDLRLHLNIPSPGDPSMRGQ